MSSSQTCSLFDVHLQHHLKKLEGRRLDYDYKKKRQGKIPDEEIQVAQEKFNESKELSGKAMVSLLELDVSDLFANWSILHLQLPDDSFSYPLYIYAFLETAEIVHHFQLALISTKAFMINLNPNMISARWLEMTFV